MSAAGFHSPSEMKTECSLGRPLRDEGEQGELNVIRADEWR